MTQRLAILSRFQRRIFYLITFLAWGSGTAWIYFQKFGRVQDEFGLRNSAMQTVALQIHGAAAMAFLMVFGSLIPLHMKPGWRQGDHRVSGSSMIASSVILILTGWGLYYIGNEDLRRRTTFLHTYLGLALPVILLVHILIARSHRKQPTRHRSHHRPT